MQMTVNLHGVPVAAVNASVVRTPFGDVALGLGLRLSAYAAYREGGRPPAAVLEVYSADGALVSATRLQLVPTPFGRVLVFAQLRDAMAAVPARLTSRTRSGGAAAR